MLRPAADHRVHQDYISDHLELTGERKEEEDCLRVVTVSVRVLIVSWLRQGIVIGHAQLVPGFAYIGPPPPES